MRKYGYIDKTGKIVIDTGEYSGRTFSEGLARMLTKEGWEFIDTKGAVKLRVKKAIQGFSDGLALAEKGFIDHEGKLILPVKNPEGIRQEVAGKRYDLLSGFHCGLSLVGRSGVSGKFAYIDKAGEIVLHGFSIAGHFQDGKAVVTKNKEVMLIDTSGKCLMKLPGKTMGDFHEGVALAPGRKIEFIDETGSIVIKTSFSPWLYVGVDCFFSEGLAAVKIKGHFGFMDRQGKLAIEPKFLSVHDGFHEGLTAVEVKSGWGFIDKKGNWVIEPRFANAQRFSHGLASVHMAEIPEKLRISSKTGR